MLKSNSELASSVVIISDSKPDPLEDESTLDRSEHFAGFGNHSELGLLEKFRESYHGRYHDPHVTVWSDRLGTALFWYVALTELYTMLTYVVPYAMEDWSETTRYYVKVMCWFGLVQTTANWACVRFVRSDYNPSVSSNDNEEFAENVANGLD